MNDSKTYWNSSPTRTSLLLRPQYCLLARIAHRFAFVSLAGTSAGHPQTNATLTQACTQQPVFISFKGEFGLNIGYSLPVGGDHAPRAPQQQP
ncbi:hypothetical protein Tco_0664842 [Tanacetum coccineum]